MPAFTLATTAISQSNPRDVLGFAGAVLLQGQIVYKHPTTQKFLLARANDPITSVIAGMVRAGSGADNTPVNVLTSGLITGLSGLTQGQIYCLAPGTAGALITYAELVTGDWINIFGYGVSATSLMMSIINTGLQKP